MHAGPFNSLWTFAPTAIIAGAVWFWTFQILRERKRRPFEGKLLRPPGEFLRCRIAELDEQLMVRLSAMVLLANLLPTAISGWPTGNASLLVQVPAAMLVSLVLGGIAFLLIRFLHLANERRNYSLGFSGERLVGEELNKLMLDGCHVFHDLPTGRVGNIDHIVVAPAGVFAIETKARRKGKTSPGEPDHKVIYDGHRLQFPDGADDAKLAQTKRNAAWLGKFLSAATGEAVAVKPVLTLPGWWVERKAWNGLAVLSHREIRKHVLHRDGPAIPKEQFQRIVHQLDQKCRDVDF
jgi:hypothetical protein